MIINSQMAGLFKVTTRRADLSVRQETDWFDNVIVNQGLNRLGTGNPYNNAIVGTGTSNAAVGQTALDARVASTTSLISATSGANVAGGYIYYRQTYRFAAGVAAGNLGEVGVGYNSTDIFSRARIVDTNADPTVITVLSNEFLDVSYELRLYWPTSDVTSTITISGQNYNTVLRASIVGSWHTTINFSGGASVSASSASSLYGTGALGAVDVGPGGVSRSTAAVYAGPLGSYSNNSYERAYRTVWGINDANGNVANAQIVTPLGVFKCSFSPELPKTNANQLTLDWKVAWGRRS